MHSNLKVKRDQCSQLKKELIKNWDEKSIGDQKSIGNVEDSSVIEISDIDDYEGDQDGDGGDDDDDDAVGVIEGNNQEDEATVENKIFENPHEVGRIEEEEEEDCEMDGIENEAEELGSFDSDNKEKGATQYNGVSSSDHLGYQNSQRPDRIDKDSEESGECSSTSATANGEQWNDNNHSGSCGNSEWMLGCVLIDLEQNLDNDTTKVFDNKHAKENRKLFNHKTSRGLFTSKVMRKDQDFLGRDNYDDLEALHILLNQDSYFREVGWPSLKRLHRRSRSFLLL